MSVSAALMIFGFIVFLFWAIPSFIHHVFFKDQGLPDPKDDDRSSIQQFQNIIGKDWK